MEINEKKEEGNLGSSSSNYFSNTITNSPELAEENNQKDLEQLNHRGKCLYNSYSCAQTTCCPILCLTTTALEEDSHLCQDLFSVICCPLDVILFCGIQGSEENFNWSGICCEGFFNSIKNLYQSHLNYQVKILKERKNLKENLLKKSHYKKNNIINEQPIEFIEMQIH